MSPSLPYGGRVSETGPECSSSRDFDRQVTRYMRAQSNAT